LENQLQGANTLNQWPSDTITIPIVGYDYAASYGYDMNFSSDNFNKNIETITISDIALDVYSTKKA
jgi:hypothetical protein